MAQDLRSHLERMRTGYPDHILRVQRELSPRFHLTAILKQLEDLGKYPTVLFENVASLNGRPGNRVCMNLTATREKIAIASGLKPAESGMELVKRLEARFSSPLPPVVVSETEAPVREEVITGEDVDIGELPIVTHHLTDAGPYLTMMAVTRHPEWDQIAPGVHNVAFHRMQYRAPDEVAMLIAPFHTSHVVDQYKLRNRPCPAAIVLGHHPLFLLGACARPSVDLSEYNVIGGLMGEPLRVVPSLTWGESLLVPADAEIVLEAEIYPDQVVDEGPFGEWTGFASGARRCPTVKIKAISQRRDRILVSHFVGHSDWVGLAGVSWEITAYQRLKQVASSISGVHFPRSGRAGFIAYVAVKKASEGEQNLAALAVATLGYPKLIVVVDEDVDVYQEEEVWRAVALCAQPDRTVQVIRDIRGSLLDPSMTHPTKHSVLVIDATRPLEKTWPTPLSVPKEAIEEVPLSSVVSMQQLDQLR